MASPLDHLPRDLSEMTGEQTAAYVDKLAQLPLTELRWRQLLTDAQIRLAYNQRNDRALANLQVISTLLMTAVFRKTKEDSSCPMDQSPSPNVTPP